VLSTQGTEGEEPSSHRAPARCQIALRAKDCFGAFFRRMRARLGTAQAITATAHKLARVVYHVLHGKEPYTETVFHRCDEQEQQRAEMRLRKHAAQLGFQLLPIPTNPAA
jgi:transposase